MLDCGNQNSGPTGGSTFRHPSKGQIVCLRCARREHHVRSTAPNQGTYVFTGFINHYALPAAKAVYRRCIPDPLNQYRNHEFSHARVKWRRSVIVEIDRSHGFLNAACPGFAQSQILPTTFEPTPHSNSIPDRSCAYSFDVRVPCNIIVVVTLRSRLPQSRQPGAAQPTVRAQRAAPQGAPSPGRPRPRSEPGVRRRAPVSGGRVGDPQPGAPRPRPGAGLRGGRLRPGGRPLRAGLQHPPPRAAAAAPGAATNRRLTAEHLTSRAGTATKRDEPLRLQTAARPANGTDPSPNLWPRDARCQRIPDAPPAGPPVGAGANAQDTIFWRARGIPMPAAFPESPHQDSYLS